MDRMGEHPGTEIFMAHGKEDYLRLGNCPTLEDATLLLSFNGWMDGGNVSTGTVERLIDLLSARPVAEIDPEPFYIVNFPGPMEVAALFRPFVETEGGVLKRIAMPTSVFYCHEPARLLLFVGKEPNMHWRSFGDCVVRLARHAGVKRILFIGSFGGSVPHTREPRMFITCSDAETLAEMEPYGVRHSDYEGPGSFTSYLMSIAPGAGLKMASLIAEIPGYLQGVNPLCIEAVTRRLAKILQLPLKLDSLRSASTEWELQISSVIENDSDLAEKVHELEKEYDNDLLKMGTEEGQS
jgi:proteasome assembly chaperone (PAC2) family protein